MPAPDFSSGWFEGPGGGGGADAGAGAEDDDEVLLVGVEPKTPEVIYISSDDEESDDDDYTSDSDIEVRESGDEKGDGAEGGAEGGDEEVNAGDDGFLDFLNHQDPYPELEGGGIIGLGGDDKLEGDEEESLDAPAPATTPAATPAPTPSAAEQEVVDIPDIDPPSPSPSLSPSPSPPIYTTNGEQGQAAHAEDWYAQFPDSSRGRGKSTTILSPCPSIICMWIEANSNRRTVSNIPAAGPVPARSAVDGSSRGGAEGATPLSAAASSTSAGRNPGPRGAGCPAAYSTGWCAGPSAAAEQAVALGERCRPRRRGGDPVPQAGLETDQLPSERGRGSGGPGGRRRVAAAGAQRGGRGR